MRVQFLLLLTCFFFKGEPCTHSSIDWCPINYKKQNSVDCFYKDLKSKSDTILLYRTDMAFPRNSGIICWKKESQFHGVVFETKAMGETEFHNIDSHQKEISVFFSFYYTIEMKMGDTLPPSKVEVIPDYDISIISYKKSIEKHHKFTSSQISGDYGFIVDLKMIVYDLEDKIKS